MAEAGEQEQLIGDDGEAAGDGGLGKASSTEGPALADAEVAADGRVEECGSAVFSRHPEDHDRMSIRMGAFDADPGIRPSVPQFAA